MTHPTSPSFVRASGVGPVRPAPDLRAIRRMLYGPSSSCPTCGTSASASGSAGSPADLEEEDRIEAARYRRSPNFDCNFYCTDYRHVLGCPTAKRELRDRKPHEKAFDDYIEAMGAMSNGRTGALSLSEAVKEATASGNAAPRDTK